MSLEFVNFTKCYHETGTDNIYFFDHWRFDEGIVKYRKSKNCTLEQLYAQIEIKYGEEFGKSDITASSIRKYRNIDRCLSQGKKNQKRTPKNIEECKFFGKMLCSCEYAFLHKFKSVDLEEKINKVYKMLYEILFMYDVSNCFNEVPDKKIGKEKEEEYFSRLIDDVQREIDCLFLFEKDETRNKLNAIVRDTRIFVKSYEMPGVVDYWLEVNPALKYFDPVFDIMETDNVLFKKICNGEYKVVRFRFIPSEEELKVKKKYLENLDCGNQNNNFRFSEERLFQNELINTLTILFKKEFN